MEWDIQMSTFPKLKLLHCLHFSLEQDRRGPRQLG